jgi:hypothetical protein
MEIAKKFTNTPGFLTLNKVSVPSYICFGSNNHFKCIFYVKFLLFVTLKSDQDPA